jgi:hypothetical protein
MANALIFACECLKVRMLWRIAGWPCGHLRSDRALFFAIAIGVIALR